MKYTLHVLQTSRAPKGSQMGVTRSQREPKGSQKGAERIQKGSQKGAKGVPKCIQKSIFGKGRENYEKGRTASNSRPSVFGAIFHQKCIQKSTNKSIAKKYEEV